MQSRRSRKQRETVYINGQHTNLLKEISSPGSDGTVPLLNFLENTDRFIADTSNLYAKIAYFEKELEKYKNMHSDFKQMKTHLQQMTDYLNNINLQDASNIQPTLKIPQFNTDHENTDLNNDTISENTSLLSTSIIQPNYFKRDTTKKITQPFPNFSHDHPIKINIDLDEPLQSINIHENDIILLPNSSAHTYKMGTGLSDIVKDVNQEPSENKDNESVLLPNSAGIRSTILLNDIYNNSSENTSNETSANNLTLIHNSSLRGSRLNINLYEPTEFEFQSEFKQNIERQLTNGSNEIEMILQKNQVSRSSKMGKLLNHRNTRRAYNASINETETNENDRYNVKLINSSTLRKSKLMNELYESNTIYQYDEIDDYDQKENTNILLKNGTTRGGLKLKFNRRNTKKAYSEIDPEPYIINKSDDNQEHQTYLLKPKQRHHGSQLNYTNEQLNEPINDELIEPSNVSVSLVYKNVNRRSKMTVYPSPHTLNPKISQNSVEIEELEYIRDLLLNSD